MTISTEELFLERERERDGERALSKVGPSGAGALYTSLSREVGASVPPSQPLALCRHTAAKRRDPHPLDTAHHGTTMAVVRRVPWSRRPLWHRVDSGRSSVWGPVRVLLINHTPSSLATWPSKAFRLFSDLSHISLILANISIKRGLKASRPGPTSQTARESLDSRTETQGAALGGPCVSHRRTGRGALFGPAVAKITDWVTLTFSPIFPVITKQIHVHKSKFENYRKAPKEKSKSSTTLKPEWIPFLHGKASICRRIILIYPGAEVDMIRVGCVQGWPGHSWVLLAHPGPCSPHAHPARTCVSGCVRGPRPVRTLGTVRLPRQTALSPPPTLLTCAGPSQGRSHEEAMVSVLEGLSGHLGNRLVSSALVCIFTDGQTEEQAQPGSPGAGGTAPGSGIECHVVPAGASPPDSPKPSRHLVFTPRVTSAHPSQGWPA